MTFDGWMAAIYWAVALAASGLYGWHAVAIFKAHIAEREAPPPKAWW